MRKPVSFSFEQKVLALSTLKTLGLSQTTMLFAKMMNYQTPPMREALQKLEHTHYLIDKGLVEKRVGDYFHTQIHCPQQSNIINEDYLKRCNQEQQTTLNTAIEYLKVERLPEASPGIN